MMFGMGHEGTTNLITKALQAVGKELETLPDPTQIHYHLPKSAAHPKVLQLWLISLLTGPALPLTLCLSHRLSVAAYLDSVTNLSLTAYVQISLSTEHVFMLSAIRYEGSFQLQ